MVSRTNPEEFRGTANLGPRSPRFEPHRLSERVSDANEASVSPSVNSLLSSESASESVAIAFQRQQTNHGLRKAMRVYVN